MGEPDLELYCWIRTSLGLHYSQPFPQAPDQKELFFPSSSQQLVNKPETQKIQAGLKQPLARPARVAMTTESFPLQTLQQASRRWLMANLWRWSGGLRRVEGWGGRRIFLLVWCKAWTFYSPHPRSTLLGWGEFPSLGADAKTLDPCHPKS